MSMSDVLFTNVCIALMLFGGFTWLVTRSWIPADPFLPPSQEFYDPDECEDEFDASEYAVVSDINEGDEDD